MRVRAVFLCVVGLHVLALVAWGSPAPIYDESGYLQGGEEIARWVRCSTGLWTGAECAASSADSLGRLAWHNPGYSALFPIAALLPGPAALWIRLLQVFAGLAAGAATYALLRRWRSDSVALVGALVVWLHPVQIFFRLTLWPVALATLGAILVALLAVRLAEAPGRVRRARQLGLALLLLVFVWPQALALVPFVAVFALRLGRPAARRVLGPLVLIWLPWALLVSLVLGRPSAMDLAAAENAALGNNPWIADGRGSALHDPEAVRALAAEAEAGCPDANGVERLRCRSRKQDAIARESIASDPAAALKRAGLRLVETWHPDEFVARHLADDRVLVHPLRGPRAQSTIGSIVRVAEVLVLLAAALAALGALRDRRVAAFMGAVLITSLPVLLTVGLTRLRQPMLCWIVIAALLVVSRAQSRAYTPRP